MIDIRVAKEKSRKKKMKFERNLSLAHSPYY